MISNTKGFLDTAGTFKADDAQPLKRLGWKSFLGTQKKKIKCTLEEPRTRKLAFSSLQKNSYLDYYYLK